MDGSSAGAANLVLGAGGVVGHAWHAGVLAALDEATGWDARHATVIVGTSAGSAVGATLRAGLSPADLYARSTGGPLSEAGAGLLAAAGMGRPPTIAPPQVDGFRRYTPASPGALLRALTPWNPRLGLLAAGGLPRGTNDTEVIAGGIGRLHGDRWPAQALWLCAVRLRDGRLVIFGRDGAPPATVAQAVAASCAIPGWFAPVRIDGEDHVDGGAHSPTNADALLGVGPELVIVSSPMSLDRAAARRPSRDRALRLLHRATLLREVVALRRSGTTVVTFQPGVEDLEVIGSSRAAMDARSRGAVARRARETTLRRLDGPAVRSALSAILG